MFIREPSDIIDSWIWLPVFLFDVLFIAYIATFFVGIPIDWLLRRLGTTSPATYALVGIVLGAAFGVNMFDPSYLAAVVTVCGLAIIVSFGLISNAADDSWI